MEMAKYRTVVRFLLSVGILFQGCDSDVKCRNDDGIEVDWYILYKLPSVTGYGLAYMYMDQSTNGWKLSTENINSKSGTLANTLKPLLDFYNKKIPDFGYMLYNDQPPNLPAVATSYGHSKGVVMLDKQTGVWLSHSTPKFPTYRSQDFWPGNGKVNAQTFMCVTYSYNDFKEIGLQLKYIHPYFYDNDIPTTFHNELRCLVAKQSCYPRDGPWFRVLKLKGQKFLSFAKYTRFGNDLYSGLIADYLKQKLYVKTWQRNGGPLPSDCSTPYHVYNVKKIQLPNMQPFLDTADHSKWCVTPDGDWTCIADINREESQKKRGGGAICINDITVAKAFKAIIKQHDPCKNAPTYNNKVVNTVMNNFRPNANKKKGAPLKPNSKNPLKLTPVLTAGKAANRIQGKNAIALQQPLHRG